MSDALSEYTTIGIGGRARRIVTARTQGELADLLAERNAIPLGYGSNVLVSDDGYDGTVVLNRFGSIDISGTTVIAGSGTSLPALCERLATAGLTGLEWACGIPGSVGGAVKMNAGAFGGQTSDRSLWAKVLRGGNIITLGADELGFGYRHSALLPGDIVLLAAFGLDRSSEPEVRGKMQAFRAARAARLPVGRSAGSVFKNPPGMSIGREIELAGFKGRRVGGAVVSQKHANVIVNTGGATARDVLALIDQIKRALAGRGINAEQEIVFIGGR